MGHNFSVPEEGASKRAVPPDLAPALSGFAAGTLGRRLESAARVAASASPPAELRFRFASAP